MGEGDPRTPAAEAKFSLEMPEGSRRELFQNDETDGKLNVNESPKKALVGHW